MRNVATRAARAPSLAPVRTALIPRACATCGAMPTEARVPTDQKVSGRGCGEYAAKFSQDPHSHVGFRRSQVERVSRPPALRRRRPRRTDHHQLPTGGKLGAGLVVRLRHITFSMRNTGCRWPACSSASGDASAGNVMKDRPPGTCCANAYRTRARSPAETSTRVTFSTRRPLPTTPRRAARAFLTQSEPSKPATM